ncbi:hypothetical protein, partial [Pseudomonas syringae group genomosp. 7]
HETNGLGVKRTDHQTQELVQKIAKKPLRPKGIFTHQPARREEKQNKIGVLFLIYGEEKNMMKQQMGKIV